MKTSPDEVDGERQLRRAGRDANLAGVVAGQPDLIPDHEPHRVCVVGRDEELVPRILLGAARAVAEVPGEGVVGGIGIEDLAVELHGDLEQMVGDPLAFFDGVKDIDDGRHGQIGGDVDDLIEDRRARRVLVVVVDEEEGVDGRQVAVRREPVGTEREEVDMPLLGGKRPLVDRPPLRALGQLAPGHGVEELVGAVADAEGLHLTEVLDMDRHLPDRAVGERDRRDVLDLPGVAEDPERVRTTKGVGGRQFPRRRLLVLPRIAAERDRPRIEVLDRRAARGGRRAAAEEEEPARGESQSGQGEDRMWNVPGP